MEKCRQIESELNKLKFYTCLFTESDSNFGVILDWNYCFTDIIISDIIEAVKKALGEEYKYYGYEILVEDVRESLNEESNAKYEFMYAIHFYRRIK